MYKHDTFAVIRIYENGNRREIFAVWIRGELSHTGQTEHHEELIRAVKTKQNRESTRKEKFLLLVAVTILFLKKL